MFRKLAFVGASLALFLLVFGAYLRLSAAGADCAGRPDCHDSAAIGANAQSTAVSAWRLSLHLIPDDSSWESMTHHYAAGLLGFLALFMVLISWREKHCRGFAMGSTLVLLLMIAAQAAVGLWSIQLKMMPIIVTLHLLLGCLIFWSFTAIYWRTDRSLIRLESTALALRILTLLTMPVLLLQIFLGGWVSTNLAGLACADFPRCHGQWIPDADYRQALDFFNGLETGQQGVLTYPGQLAAHWLHRAGAVISIALVAMVMLAAVTSTTSRQIRKAGWWLSALLVVQVSLGILTVKLSLPLWISVAHNGVAALVMLPLIAIRFYARFAYAEMPSQQPAREQVAREPVITKADVAGAPLEEVYVEAEPESLLVRLKTQLHKTRSGLGGVLTGLAPGGKSIDQSMLEDIEARLLMADVGIEATNDIIAHLTENLKRHELTDMDALSRALKQNLCNMLEPCSRPLVIPKQTGPFVILVVGVNGVGKTTSIGKLAKRLQSQGYSVMLAAGDTFRAAAVEQLQTWGERNHIHVVAQHTGADSASVIFDGVQSAKAKHVDVLIADTAGRLHTKSNLMEELTKIKRIMARLDESAPHEVLLVLDAGTGQNALSQARLFDQAVKLTGLAVTKLDGTAKGGVIFALAKQMGVPIRFIGIGEGIDDLQDFDAGTFVDALFVQD